MKLYILRAIWTETYDCPDDGCLNIYDNVTFPCAGPYGIAYLPVGRKAAV
jgi:hypothetical protein